MTETNERILFLSPTDENGILPRHALEALGAAVEMAAKIPGSTLTVGLWGKQTEGAAASLAGCGAQTCFAVSGDAFGDARYSTDTAAAEALVKKSGATLVVAPATSRVARALPGVASRVGGRIDTRIVGFEADGGKLLVKRWYYRQRMAATLTRTHRPWLLTIDGGVFPAWKGEGAGPAVEAVPIETSSAMTRTKVEGVEAAAGSAQTIRPDADLLFVAGAGWTKKQDDGATHVPEAEKTILEFLERSQASLGGSKSLVEQGGEGGSVLSFMTHLNQVGQTGASPRHPKGLSTCCHGEEPHVVGWRFIAERRAVNKDPGCGWARGKADVLYVADAFEVMAKVNALLGGK